MSPIPAALTATATIAGGIGVLVGIISAVGWIAHKLEESRIFPEVFAVAFIFIGIRILWILGEAWLGIYWSMKG